MAARYHLSGPWPMTMRSAAHIADSARVPIALDAACAASRTSSSGSCSGAGVPDGGKTARSSRPADSNSLMHQMARFGTGSQAGLPVLLAQRNPWSAGLSAVRRAVAGAPECASRADRVSGFAGRSGCHWLAGLAGPHDAGFVGQHDHLDPVAQSELGQDAGDVAFHRGIAEVQPPAIRRWTSPWPPPPPQARGGSAGRPSQQPRRPGWACGRSPRPGGGRSRGPAAPRP